MQRFPKLFSTFVANIFAMEKPKKDIGANNEQVIQLPKIIDERGNLYVVGHSCDEKKSGEGRAAMDLRGSDS